MTSVSIRPSDARREALKEADAEMGSGRGVPLVSNFFPIERYYDAADKVLLSFHQAFEEKRLDDAYVYGKRFAAFSLDALPQHNYYRLPKYQKWRKKNGQDMATVIQKLEQVAKWMDEEEVARERERKRLLQQHHAKIQKQKQEERNKMRELQAKIEQARTKSHLGTSDQVANSALSKLEKLNTMYPANEKKRPLDNGQYERHSSASLTNRRDASDRSLNMTQSLDEHGRRASSDYSLDESMEWELIAQDTDPLPPPIPPPSAASPVLPPPPATAPTVPPPPLAMAPTVKPPTSLSYHVPNANELFPPPPSYQQIAPPSYNQVATHNKLFPPANNSAAVNSHNHSSWPAGGAVVRPSVPPPLRPEKLKPMKPKRIPIRKLKDQATYEYKLLRQSKKIDVFGLDTYQGRYRSSTNGCTVISPLVVSEHLKARHAVSDSAIVDVIDNLCGPILRDIRSKLQLEGDALIIPSDVHDYMVDRKILQQDRFVGASGGNIIDEEHLGEFLKLLERGEGEKEHLSKKAGGVLFFREHVVSIVKVPTGSSSSSSAFCYDLVDSMPGVTLNNKLCATRTRCKDMVSLKALLLWYACSKFSDSNCAYIDQNEWNESMADFDPRVFQAFVWADV